MLKLIATGIIGCFLASNASIAQNLVPNPGFEGYVYQFCGLSSSNDFSQSVLNWYSPTSGSPDSYYSNIADTCFNFQATSQYSGAIGIKGSQLPRTGEAMAGFYTYTIQGLNQREYIQVELVSPLTIGFYYAVDYYVSLADSTEFSTDDIGALFSVGQVSASNGSVLNYTPQISSSIGFLDDVTEWMLISDTLYAQDNYTHLTIGNFRNDNTTNLLPNPSFSGGVGTYGAYYYIDDIQIEEVRGLSVNVFEDDVFALYPNPATDKIVIELNDEYSIQNLELVNGLGQQIAISPTPLENGKFQLTTSNLENGVYFLRLNDPSIMKTAKVIVRH